MVLGTATYAEMRFGEHLRGWIRTGHQRPRALVFVHGFTGDALSTWTADAGDPGPPPPSFMSLIMDDDSLDDFDVFSFGYTSRVLRSAPPIETIVQQFRNSIGQALHGYAIVLCGHSMGGLVCMSYVISELRLARPLPVLGLILYGTPVEGSAWVNAIRLLLHVGSVKLWFLQFFAKYLFRSRSQLASLAVAHEFLRALRSEWALHIVNGGDLKLPNSQRASIQIRVVSGNEDLFVSEASAKSYFGDLDWYPVQSGHVGMVKPDSQNHESYRALQSFLPGCRYADTPAIRARLREICEGVWNRRSGKLLKDWKYRLECYGAHHASVKPWNVALEGMGFAVTRVVECEYQTLISREPYALAFAYGPAAEARAWEANPAYVHYVRVDTESRERKAAITAAFEAALSMQPDDAWSALFRNPRVRVREVAGTTWFDLVPEQAVADATSIARRYTLPSQALHLIDREAVLGVTFDSVRPQELSDVSVEFPWLTYRFKAEITVHGRLDFVNVVDHVFPPENSSVKVNDLGSKTSVSLSVDDLVLPDSFIRLKWLEQEPKEKTP